MSDNATRAREIVKDLREFAERESFGPEWTGHLKTIADEIESDIRSALSAPTPALVAEDMRLAFEVVHNVKRQYNFNPFAVCVESELLDQIRLALATARADAVMPFVEAGLENKIATLLCKKDGLELLIYDNDGKNYGVRLIDTNTNGPAKCIQRISFDLPFVIDSFIASIDALKGNP